SATSALATRISPLTNRASKTFSSSWSTARRSRHESQRHRRDLQVRDGALGPDALAEPDHAGDHHDALLRGLRFGDRRPHDADGGGELRRFHRARTGLALSLYAVDLQRQLRHLFSEVYRHDLRTALSSDLEFRGGYGLCRSGGHQVGDP